MSSTRATERIQQSKLLRPSPGIWELQRPRLVERLNEGQGAPLSIICGMAGSGKTTLARQWSIQVGSPVAWVTLDEGDNELGRFVHLIAAAVRSVFPKFGPTVLGELRMSARHAAEDLATIFADDIVAVQTPVILVIDELHAIHNPAVFDFLVWLFRVPPPNLHVCVVSRTDPPLPLVRYRARYHLTEIRLAQLLLSLDETREFLQDIAHAALSMETVRKLHDETEGWITGLHLTALAIRDAEGEPDSHILRQRATIDAMEFLANEIVERVPEPVQRRLLLLAVPERINAELSWHLLNASPDDTKVDVGEMLTYLEASGYFLVSLGEDRTWYRFHPLFRDVLLETAERRFGADSIRTGHRLAADWFSTNRYIDQAIRHALAAGDIEHAADLVEQHAQYALATDNWLSLEWWLKQIPESIRAQRIELILAQAWIYQVRGTHQDILPLLIQARLLLATGARPLSADRDALDAEIELLDVIGQLATASATVLRTVGEKAWRLMASRDRAGVHYGLFFIMLGSIEDNCADEAIHMLDGIVEEHRGREDAFAVARALSALAYSGIAHLWLGNLDATEAHSEQILAVGTASGFMRMVEHANTLLGSVCLQRNQLEQAAQYFRTTADEPLSGILIKREALYDLARTAALVGDDTLADDAISRLMDLIYSVNWTFSLPTVRALQADIARLRGNHAIAVQWAESTMPDAEGGALASVINPSLIKARILVSEPMRSPQHLQDASAILGILAKRLETQPIHRLWIAVRTLQAIIFDLTGSPAEALRLLAETIDSARGHIRPFLDEGPRCAELLERLVERDGRSGFRGVLLDASRAEANRRTPSHPTDPAIVPVDPTNDVLRGAEGLSTREREILGYLAQRHSNKEIAEALGISPLTVKRHTINLYAKLGVNGRRQAVRAYYRPA